MSAVVGAAYPQLFSTGVASETFTRVTSYVNGSVVVWSPTFTDLGSGRYLMTFTPTVPGSHAWLGTKSVTGDLEINFDVLTAAQADPLGALLSAYANSPGTAGKALQQIGALSIAQLPLATGTGGAAIWTKLTP